MSLEAQAWTVVGFERSGPEVDGSEMGVRGRQPSDTQVEVAAMGPIF